MFKLIVLLILFQVANNVNASSSSDQNDTSNENSATTNGNQTDEFGDELTNKLRLVPLTDAINDFGMQLIRKLNNATNGQQQTKNVAFSPLSISQIFSMIISSAQNETLSELMNVFGYADQLQTPDNVNNAFNLLLNEYDKSKLETSKRKIKLSLPSIALYSADFNIKKSFRKNLKDNYKADASKIDFTNNEAVDLINDFVNKNTNGLIPKLIEKLDPETKLALVNAFYFKGDWSNQFDKNLNMNRAFNNVDKTTSKIQSMFKRENYSYFEDNDVQVIVLPYAGNASMTILLPQKNRSIDGLIQNLNNSLIDYYRYQMKSNLVELHLPKFKIESSTDLKEPITDMGVVKIFGPKAELGGISSFKNVYVSEAIHKAFLDVNEQGTQAASSSGIGIMTKTFARDLKRMVIDRPFVFLIHDTMNNLVLFMGSVKKL